MDEPILWSEETGICRLILNRPDKRNALTRQMLETASQLVQAASSNAEHRLLMLEAKGKVFCAGMDLGEMKDRAAESDAQAQWLRDSQIYADLLKRLYTFPAPTLAVVQGPVLAGGMGLALACDLVLASRDASFALPEPVRGITAAMVTPLLVQRVGAGWASFALLSGQPLSAEQGLAIGLCHSLAEPQELERRRGEWAQRVLTGSPEALRITKRHVHHCAHRAVVDLIDYSIEVSAVARQTEDAQEGRAAFLEKRPPRWQPTPGA